ncbi:MAG: hypothetical protein ACE366_24680 [Bradymonadia bacterium]
MHEPIPLSDLTPILNEYPGLQRVWFIQGLADALAVPVMVRLPDEP